MTRDERGCIAVFAKPPRPGQAKTRLAPELGDAGAAALARAFFLDTWETVSRLSWAEPVLATTDVAASEWSFLDRARVWLQGDGSLGHRLARILGRALEQFPFAIAIGTDSPGQPAALLQGARVALRESDAVLGPSDDGGFYLIGLRRCPSDLLTELPWSAPDTFACTLRRLDSRGLSTAVLPPWFDVDRPDDLRRLRRRIEDGAGNGACAGAGRSCAEVGRVPMSARLHGLVLTRFNRGKTFDPSMESERSR